MSEGSAHGDLDTCEVFEICDQETNRDADAEDRRADGEPARPTDRLRALQAISAA